MADAKRELVECIADFGDDALRDIWLFNPTRYEALYLRDDVAANIEDINVNKFVDNERYGYITRDTYNALSHAAYQYSVHGFDEFEQFRAFLGEKKTDPGVFISLDAHNGAYDFGELYNRLMEFTSRVDASSMAPKDIGQWSGD
ncbi:hypothetical protein [Haladaptatus sp. DJG-WS-42]|uniref:DUF7522 family protein n=1 Tax=Haladaptatus sp. DJG-WS-42 TaxID=3120516 RepID=UPI0030CFD085